MRLADIIKRMAPTWRKFDTLPDVHWVLESLQADPVQWCRAWEVRYAYLQELSDLGQKPPTLREVWWSTESMAKTRRRGKLWTSVTNTLLCAEEPRDIPDATYTWSAAVDAATDALSLLISVEGGAALVRAQPEPLKFMMHSGNDYAWLAYPAALVHAGAVSDVFPESPKSTDGVK
jgi:hypothetical protein